MMNVARRDAEGSHLCVIGDFQGTVNQWAEMRRAGRGRANRRAPKGGQGKKARVRLVSRSLLATGNRAEQSGMGNVSG